MEKGALYIFSSYFEGVIDSDLSYYCLRVGWIEWSGYLVMFMFMFIKFLVADPQACVYNIAYL